MFDFIQQASEQSLNKAAENIHDSRSRKAALNILKDINEARSSGDKARVAQDMKILEHSRFLPELALNYVRETAGTTEPLGSGLQASLHGLESGWNSVKSSFSAGSSEPMNKDQQIDLQNYGMNQQGDRPKQSFSGTDNTRQQSNIEPPNDGLNHPFSAAEIARASGNAVDQAGWGDCWFESSLCGEARTNDGSQKISQAITRSGDGYDVKFPDDPNHPIHVSDREIKADHLNNKENLCFQVLEAAEIKRHPDLAKNGADPAIAIHDLTDKPAATYPIEAVSADDLANKLKEGPVVAFNSSAPSAAMGRGSDLGSSPLIQNHAYTVEAYDPTTGTVTLRNPGGMNDGRNFDQPGCGTVAGQTRDGVTDHGNGVLTMSYDKFRETCSNVSAVDDSLSARAETGISSMVDKFFKGRDDGNAQMDNGDIMDNRDNNVRVHQYSNPQIVYSSSYGIGFGDMGSNGMGFSGIGGFNNLNDPNQMHEMEVRNVVFHSVEGAIGNGLLGLANGDGIRGSVADAADGAIGGAINGLVQDATWSFANAIRRKIDGPDNQGPGDQDPRNGNWEASS